MCLPARQVHPEGKYVVDVDKSIDITKLQPSARVALRNDSYVLHLVLPSKVDPLVSLMRVEKVPDSTYDMIGGLDQQIKEIKEVREGGREGGRETKARQRTRGRKTRWVDVWHCPGCLPVCVRAHSGLLFP